MRPPHGKSSSRRDLGDFGERVARAHLEAKGYRVLAAGFRCPEGQIDLVAERDGVVAFVEVKTRHGDAMGAAIEGVDERQAARLLEAADVFALEHPGLPPGRRIDLIAIDLERDGRVRSVQHIESAVEDA